MLHLSPWGKLVLQHNHKTFPGKAAHGGCDCLAKPPLPTAPFPGSITDAAQVCSRSGAGWMALNTLSISTSRRRLLLLLPSRNPEQINACSWDGAREEAGEVKGRSE